MALDETRSRLLDAAGHEFAEKGYEGATVRSICDRAGVNLAAVNYHFGDKERLYEAVLLMAHRSRPKVDLAPPGQDPRVGLRQFVARFLHDMIEQSERPWHQALMAREVAQPSKASDVLVREAIRPSFEYLATLIRQLGPDLSPRQVHAAGFSVVAQCLHYKMSRSISERIIGAAAFEQLDTEFLVDHITQFTLAALGQAAPLSGQTTGAAERATPHSQGGDQ